jgi:hypothetical protein
MSKSRRRENNQPGSTARKVAACVAVMQERAKALRNGKRIQFSKEVRFASAG